ncbi:SAV_6107 family HEPN domain-containing protein [Hamadaea sp.]|uniref:SAV_6107 family HEPN domain-containing protein n=1 Tax=Hamadaea sp. TaxID=2024425 RepID=UPI0025C6D864|nr:SAV_6107 family HEPN domain-containing protein [Hamadaea sp.]
MTTPSLTTGAARTPVSAHLLPHRTPVELLALARRGLIEAAAAPSAAQRYATAHLAALRVAAAVLAMRAQPVTGRRRSRVTSAWLLLTKVAPELAEWAEFFAAGAAKRSAAEAGIAKVTAREADDLVRATGQFIDVVQGSLGLSHPTLVA